MPVTFSFLAECFLFRKSEKERKKKMNENKKIQKRLSSSRNSCEIEASQKKEIVNYLHVGVAFDNPTTEISIYVRQHTFGPPGIFTHNLHILIQDNELMQQICPFFSFSSSIRPALPFHWFTSFLNFWTFPYFFAADVCGFPPNWNVMWFSRLA